MFWVDPPYRQGHQTGSLVVPGPTRFINLQLGLSHLATSIIPFATEQVVIYRLPFRAHNRSARLQSYFIHVIQL